MIFATLECIAKLALCVHEQNPRVYCDSMNEKFQVVDSTLLIAVPDDGEPFLLIRIGLVIYKTQNRVFVMKLNHSVNEREPIDI